MILHEFLEKGSAPLLVFRDFLSRWRYRHSAYVAHCKGSGDINSQGKPFDVAVKFPREEQRSLQCRIHEVMLLGRNENGLKAHGDLQSERTSLSVRAARREISRRFAHKPRQPLAPPVAICHGAS